jgi:hypothetical protein
VILSVPGRQKVQTVANVIVSPRAKQDHAAPAPGPPKNWSRVTGGPVIAFTRYAIKWHRFTHFALPSRSQGWPRLDPLLYEGNLILSGPKEDRLSAVYIAPCISCYEKYVHGCNLNARCTSPYGCPKRVSRKHVRSKHYRAEPQTEITRSSDRLPLPLRLAPERHIGITTERGRCGKG